MEEGQCVEERQGVEEKARFMRGGNRWKKRQGAGGVAGCGIEGKV